MATGLQADHRGKRTLNRSHWLKRSGKSSTTETDKKLGEILKRLELLQRSVDELRKQIPKQLKKA